MIVYITDTWIAKQIARLLDCPAVRVEFGDGRRASVWQAPLHETDCVSVVELGPHDWWRNLYVEDVDEMLLAMKKAGVFNRSLLGN